MGQKEMKIQRKFTKAGQDAYSGINFVTTTSEIRNPDGTIVFKLENVEVPDTWSQVASDVIAQKYFRKAGVPSVLKKSEREKCARISLAFKEIICIDFTRWRKFVETSF